ncbi:MAG: ribosomal protein S18-alanine N-acetyltransferase, partial [Chloroflexi bacterium]|nr:ribosomal protein S18-alanine N-acetyltransferase [Chloroflexota bacterium]
GYWRVVDEGHICTLAVRQAWRGRGLGELLLLSLIEHALSSGIEMMTLEVRVSNAVAQSLYQKYGFERLGRRKGYYGDNGEDAWIMSTGSIRAEAYRHMLAERKAALLTRLMAANPAPPEPETAPWPKGVSDAQREKG